MSAVAVEVGHRLLQGDHADAGGLKLRRQEMGQRHSFIDDHVAAQPFLDLDHGVDVVLGDQATGLQEVPGQLDGVVAAFSADAGGHQGAV